MQKVHGVGFRRVCIGVWSVPPPRTERRGLVAPLVGSGSDRILHFVQTCTNALVYSPPSAPHASPWPGLVGKTSVSMILVAGPPVPTSEVAFRALRAAPSAPIGTAVHRRDTGDAAASHTGALCTWHCTGSRPAVPADEFCALPART